MKLIVLGICLSCLTANAGFWDAIETECEVSSDGEKTLLVGLDFARLSDTQERELSDIVSDAQALLAKDVSTEEGLLSTLGAWHGRNKKWMIPLEALLGGFLLDRTGVVDVDGAWKELRGSSSSKSDKATYEVHEAAQVVIVPGDGSTVTFSDEEYNELR